MRKVTIYQPQALTDPNKHFQDAGNDNAIRCSFDLEKKCTPNCAACDISKEDFVDNQENKMVVAICLRSDGVIGEIPGR